MSHQQFNRAAPIIGVMILALNLMGCGTSRETVNVEATVAAAVAATRQTEVNLQATVEAAVAATQQAGQLAVEPGATPLAPAGPAPTELPQPLDPELVRMVILAEVNGAIARNLALLQSLYAPEAVVIDHQGTPGDPGDDTVWSGWANIERRYQAFFSAGFSTIELVDLSIQVSGDQAVATHQGAILDGTYYEDSSLYTLAKVEGRWLITRLEYGNKPGPGPAAIETGDSRSGDQPRRDDGLYILAVGNQHRYEEPWGWDRGDPCRAWETGDFDDTKPNYRGFNVELLLTNKSDKKIPDQWPVSFTTAKGQAVQACYYAYEGSGPPPGATSSVTFFTVVEKGDYVEKITFNLEGQTVQLCLDGQGGWRNC